jgi:hypothetical protein
VVDDNFSLGLANGKCVPLPNGLRIADPEHLSHLNTLRYALAFPHVHGVALKLSFTVANGNCDSVTNGLRYSYRDPQPKRDNLSNSLAITQ